jgi:hypothetical protein
VLKYFSQVGTQNFWEQGCARIFWSTSNVEFEGKEGALEYFSQRGMQNLVKKGAPEYFGRLLLRRI